MHTGVAKNARQAYAVKKIAGEQTSAISWGTGRAVARIPRVSGGGTHRSGQAAFGNMYRGGRMFAPNKPWRKWHVKVATGQRRYATCSALAASAIPALVQARGHRVSGVPELPLVVSNSAQSIAKTANAAKFLAAFGADEDVQRVKDSRKLRAGKGKLRNRRYVQRRGPLVIYSEDDGITRAFRNIPGVDLANVNRLNLLQLAPGGHVGRFIIWTESAFKALDKVFGTQTKASQQKIGFTVPYGKMTNADLARIINSDEIQSVVRDPITTSKYQAQKKNPLKNNNALFKLNPYAQNQKRQAMRAKVAGEARKAKLAEARRKGQSTKNSAKVIAATKKRNAAKAAIGAAMED